MRDIAELRAAGQVTVTCEPWQPVQAAEPEAQRSERVARAQEQWLSEHAGDREPWSPASVIADMMRDPGVRTGVFGQAMAQHGPPYCEARGPGDLLPDGSPRYGPLEREYFRIERERVIAAEARLSRPGEPKTDLYYQLTGEPPPPGGGKRVARNPFAEPD